MSTASWSGLLEGIENQLTPDEDSLLRNAFATYQAEHFRYSVRRPGEQILHSLSTETSCTPVARSQYQETLLGLLRAARAGGDPDPCCCEFHRALFPDIVADIAAGRSTWLRTFLEMLTALTESVHFQFASAMDARERCSVELSRLMTLEAFVKFHANENYSRATRKKFVQRLAPHLSRRARENGRRGGELGTWRNRIGSYSSPTPVPSPGIEAYARDCPSIKPFSTLTHRILSEFNREEPPDSLLQALGMPHDAGATYIELIFCSEDVRFHRVSDRRSLLAIPTMIEAAGNWAFRPDRDSPPETNFTLNLGTEARGLPELLHNPLDHSSLQDAIVWPMPTRSTWADGSPLSTGPSP